MVLLSCGRVCRRLACLPTGRFFETPSVYTEGVFLWNKVNLPGRLGACHPSFQGGSCLWSSTRSCIGYGILLNNGQELFNEILHRIRNLCSPPFKGGEVRPQGGRGGYSYQGTFFRKTGNPLLGGRRGGPKL